MVALPGCGPAGPAGPVAPVEDVSTADAGPPVVDTLQPPGWDSGPPRWRPAGPDERLMWREGGSELGFAEQPCARQGPCGCEVPTEHHYSRVDGRWKIVVVTPDVVYRKVVVRGTCEEGCGVQAPPSPRPVRSLGAARPEDVEIVERHPRRVVEIRTCTDPIVRP